MEKMYHNKVRRLKCLILIALCLTFSYSCIRDTKSYYLASLVLKTKGGCILPEYGLFIAQYLREIGIKVEIQIEEWSVFYGKELSKLSFDLAIIDMSFNPFNPDPSTYFSINGSKNIFARNLDIPYLSHSEELLALLYQEDEYGRQQLLYSWEQLLMDKILSCFPLFSYQKYISTWSSLEGFDVKWSLSNNMPYLSFSETHEGQKSIQEFVFRDSNFINLNPLLYLDDASKNIVSFLTEPIIQISPENELLSTGLIYNWEEVNESYYRFYVRDDVFWNPSFNITERTESSPQLDIGSTPLMSGLKGDYSNGTNQRVKARDIAFTLLALATKDTSIYYNQYRWIKEINLDPTNDSIFTMLIDANPETEELEIFQGTHFNFSFLMSVPCLPEFFLNSSDETVSYTSGNIPVKGLYNVTDSIQWNTYSYSAFGCGKYMLDYVYRNDKIVLEKNPNWFGIGPREGKNQSLSIDKVLIRIIPDDSVSLKEFKEGKLDLFDISSFRLDRLEMEIDKRFEIHSTLSSDMSCLVFNLDRSFIGGADNYVFLDIPGKEEYTKGVAVRKAICYAIDREEMNEVFHDGEYIVSHNPIPPFFSFYYYDNVIKFYRDLDAAFEWFRATGYGYRTIYFPEDHSDAFFILTWVIVAAASLQVLVIILNRL
ncbi:MAG: hypothetical protein H7641_09860, partial [Candidatus Heimdallarchaeota archaeon]|nr:hypothetical protein [Candidatus Heimdallarchaeota archaeon]MCK4877867.1 hypothetical protein [Candidatus Heimdallarchaeota archaeon]